MKKLMMMLIVAFYCLVLSANNPKDVVVISVYGKMECKKISFSKQGAHILDINGQEKILSNEEIFSYTLNGIEYVRLPLYVDHTKTDKMAFMQFIKEKNGYNLYKVTVLEKAVRVDHFYVYNKEEFVMQTNETNLNRTFKWFGFKPIIK